MMNRALAPCAIALALAACGPVATPDRDRFGECQAYATQIAGRPADDARAHWKQGDRKLASLAGAAEIVPLMYNDPQLPAANRRDIVDRLGTRPIEGAAGDIGDEGCLRFSEAGLDYARGYNQELLRLANAAP
jgi:hypothetical protein